MKNKKFNISLIFSILLIVTFTSIFNYIIDPFAVFHNEHRFNRLRTNIDKNHRVSKIPSFKLLKDNVDAIWVGSSKTGWSTNEKYESSVLKQNIKNMAINSCSFYEAITMIKNAVLIHPEIKTIYFGIDFCMMGKGVEKSNSLQLVKNPKLTKEEILPLILSFDTFQNSFKTFSKNLKKVKIQEGEYGAGKNYNKKVFHKFKNTINTYHSDFYHNFVLDEQKFADLLNIVDWADKQGIKIVFFTTTMHSAERILINNCGLSDSFYEFKRKLSKIQPYWDFAVINKYTTEEIKPDMQSFRDAVHAYPNIRKKITNNLFGLKEDFGTYISTENIDTHIKNEQKLFDNYLEKNDLLVKKVEEWSN